MLMLNHEVSLNRPMKLPDSSDLSRSVFVSGISGTAGAAETGVILVGAQSRVHDQLTVRQFRLIHTVRWQALTPGEIYRE